MNTSGAFRREVDACALPPVPPVDEWVRPAELAGLAEPIRRYFDFMRVVDRGRVWSFRARWTGRFRRSPDAPWKPCEAWQYNSRVEVARVFRLRVRWAPLVPIVAHDRYVHGHGHLIGKLYDRFTLVDAEGPELDAGELTTYLSDAVLFAPSMLLGAARFEPVDDRHFDVSLADGGRTVRGRVHIEEHGEPIDFSTLDRFVEDPDDPTHAWRRAEWHTPVDGYAPFGARILPVSERATWILASGPFTYADLRLDPASVAFNV